jgi:uncharacterized protein (TIGR00299 family) protein
MDLRPTDTHAEESPARERGKVAYLDCGAGVCGNMLLGALADLGLGVAFFRDLVRRLALDGVRVLNREIKRRGLRAMLIEVEWDGNQESRGLDEVAAVIEAGALEKEIKRRSIEVFEKLARTEADVHGESVETVHFHEVGAVDSIVDIVGTVAGLAELGVKRIECSPLPIGRGQVDCSHGTLPLPAPATARLLRGTPIFGVDVRGETVTPTGAALVTTLAGSFGPLPAMTLTGVGDGAGHHDLGLPGFLRIFTGTLNRPDWLPNGLARETNILAEANIDDMNPQLYEHVMSRMFAAGALDVFLTPIQMKKNRPATKLSVLTAEENLAGVARILFEETTSIGFRVTPVTKYALEREVVEVPTRWGPVPVKVARFEGRAVNRSPEHDVCRAIAGRQGIPLGLVMEEALRLCTDD